VVPVLKTIDSVEELEGAIKDPQSFLPDPADLPDLSNLAFRPEPEA
jgi:hypothetical protein